VKGGTARPVPSLKGRALQWLAQREHSRSELRRKLLTHARAQAALSQARVRAAAELLAEAAAGAADDGNGGAAGGDGQAHDGSDGDNSPPADLQAEVDAVLDWLAAHRYLSEERFAESRVHARAGRFGNLRIRQELAQHGVEMAPAVSQALKDSELDRARAVRERKFGASAAGAADRARQQRFLAGRGFSPEVIHQLLRSLPRSGSDHGDVEDTDT
jgi:regulatory protein